VAGISFQDLRRADWLATFVVAGIRGVCSGIVLAGLDFATGYYRSPTAPSPVYFLIEWPLISIIGMPATFYLFKGIAFALSRTIGGIATTASSLMLFFVSLIAAIGDPLLWIINRFLPVRFQVTDLHLFNFVALLVVLRNEQASPPPQPAAVPLAESIQAPLQRPSAAPELPPRAGGAAEISSQADADDDIAVELLRTCNSEPLEGLAWIERVSPEAKATWQVMLAKFIALRNLAFETFLGAGPTNLTESSDDELREHFDPEHLAHVTAALRQAGEMERSWPGRLQAAEDDGEAFLYDILEQLCFVSERLNPTSVQRLLGWTKLRYLNDDRLKQAKGVDSAGQEANWRRVLDTAVRTPECFMSAIAMFTELNNGILGIRFGVFRRSVAEVNVSGEAEMLGQLHVQSNGQFSFIPLIVDEPPRPAPRPSAGRPRDYRPAFIAASVAAVILAAALVVAIGWRSMSPKPLPAGTTAFATPVSEALPAGPGTPAVHVRSGPGTQFPPIDALGPGAPLVAVGRAVDTEGLPWIAIRRGDGTYGFIKERLISGAPHS
jgi:hypothetical protein